jgi:hypothetical protein
MTAMRAVELPEQPAEALAITAAPGPGQGQHPGENAASRAAVRWARPGPVTAAPATRPQSPHPRAASVPLRLTRRGRIVMAVAAVLLLSLLSLIVARSAEATNQAPARPGPGLAQVTVSSGQSLWSVAENADPSADTRVVVQQIVELNGLTGSAVFAGQRLWVPRA